tara:strand:+ start:159 stop:410 length:252 start_codon:yes stop_codon:yes gene_type:complete
MRGVITNATYLKKEKESGKLRMCGGAWTINLKEIDGLVIQTFKYVTESFEYSIDYHKAFGRGFIKNFRGEDKLVVPINHWTIK